MAWRRHFTNLIGKTVQMIATMVKNPANIDQECKATLVVVPAALLQQASSITSDSVSRVFTFFQWKDEVESKTNRMFTVHIHHGKDKIKVGFLLEGSS